MSTETNKVRTLDPRDESQNTTFVLATRAPTLDGKVVGLLANNKPHSEELLKMMANIIGERYDIKGIVEYNKRGHQWPATPEALKELSGKCDVMIHATAE